MKSRKPHSNVLVQLAKVDGIADENELDFIQQIGSSHNISDEDVDLAIAEAEASDPIPSLTHLNANDRFDLLYNLVLVMKAEGIIHRTEMKFCLDIVKKLDFDEEVLFDLLKDSPESDPDAIYRSSMIERAEAYFKG